MPVEIERKFLVTGSGWRDGQVTRICQGYLNRAKERTVRVRILGGKGFLTIKGINSGAARAEYEYEIPISHAEELLRFAMGRFLRRTVMSLATMASSGRWTSSWVKMKD